MKVVPINSRKPKIPFNCQAPRVHSRVPEGLKVLLGIATTCWLPTLMLCISFQHALPFVLTLTSEVVGTLMGLMIYALRPPYQVTSCVPVSRTPAIAVSSRDKRAA